MDRIGVVRVEVLGVMVNVFGRRGLCNGMSLEILSGERTRTMARLLEMAIFRICGLYFDGVISCWDAAGSSATIMHGWCRSRVCGITRCCWHLVRSFDHACASAVGVYGGYRTDWLLAVDALHLRHEEVQLKTH